MIEFEREKIKNILRVMVVNAYNAKSTESDLFRNTLDCFSCTIDAMIQDISIDEWMKQEKVRQSQKTLQNSIGDFHQKVLGTIEGIQDLGTGGIVDLLIERAGVIAEVKNKWNTTKGNHKPNIYDDLEAVLEKYSGYTAYYVEILPKNGKRYNNPFIPSDNKTKQKRIINEHIRVIDGYSFYALVTGKPDALKELYLMIPELICEILNEEFNLKRDPNTFKKSEEFMKIFNLIFP